MRMSDFINYLSFGKTKYSEEDYLLLYESYCDAIEKYHNKSVICNYLKILFFISTCINIFLIYFFA